MTSNNCEDETCDGTPLMPLSLTTLPPELLLTIITHLPTPSCLVLRRVSHFFMHLIPKPTHSELLAIEAEPWATQLNLFTCGSCLRLLPSHKFSNGMTDDAYMLEAGGPKADERFCHECGVRELPGEFRYQVGEYWMFKGVYRTRCKICENVGRQPVHIEVGACELCHEEKGGRDDEGRKAWREKMERVEYKEEVEVDSCPPREPITLCTLHPELLLAVIGQLGSDDQLVLRGVSRLFASFIPKPTHSELLAIERDDRDGWIHGHELFTCGGCVRLRHSRQFDMSKRSYREMMQPGGLRAHKRFCNDCGVRDLPGEFRYGLGEHWRSGGWRHSEYWVRCRVCEKVGQPPHYMDVGLCETCFEKEQDRFNERNKDWLEILEGEVDSEGEIVETPPKRQSTSLSTLPPELLLAITTHLGSDDRLILRLVSRGFTNLLPKPTHSELITYETQPWASQLNLFTCGGCLSLRPASKFDLSQKTRSHYQLERGGVRAAQRFCTDCGVRDLPGTFRYDLGAVWFDKYGVHGVRCESCERIGEPPEEPPGYEGRYSGLCRECFFCERNGEVL